MKKTPVALLSIGILALSGCSIISGGGGLTPSGGDSSSSHEHVFSRVLTWDDEYHWYPAECGHDVVSEKVPHEYHDWWTVDDDPSKMQRDCIYCNYTQIVDSTGVKYEIEYGADHAQAHSIDARYVGPVVVEAEFQGMPVTELPDGAFENASLTSLSVPSTIEKVGYTAFDGLPDSIFTEYQGGYYCGNEDNPYHIFVRAVTTAKSVIMHEDTKQIAPNAFWRSEAEEIVCGDTITKLNYNTFACAVYAKRIVLPKNIRSIPYATFHQCIALESLELPRYLTSIGNQAFYDCRALTELVIPNAVTTIGDACFNNCESLTSLTLPGSLEELGTACFYRCKKLPEISIGNGMTSFYVHEGSLYQSKNNETWLVFVPQTKESVNIQSTVKVIGDYALDSCDKITHLTLPDDLRVIGIAAFRACRKLTGLVFPDFIEKMGRAAFQECHGLTEINLPINLLSVGERCFKDCYNVESITYPSRIYDFRQIKFGESWHDGIPNVKAVQCTDGLAQI